ncbi:MAG: DUF169 domain-containing protein [Candidatus Lokiarchaeota archaeon]
MTHLTVNEIGKKLKQAGRLESIPLCIYGSKTIPEKAVPIRDLNRCIAHAIFSLSTHKTINSIYIGENTLEGCCPGGQSWFGYKSINPQLKYFVSIGSKDYRNGAAEFLLANPELAEQQLNSIGKIPPIGKYTVIEKSNTLNENKAEVKSFLCFGRSEQIRNLCSLAYFQPEKGFLVKMPWGPSCASFVTYPSSLAEDDQTKHIIIGPTDPTGNYWFPQDYLSIGIPIKIAERMANDYDASFITKRTSVAYPKKREK